VSILPGIPVPLSHDASARLAHLEQILAQTTAASTTVAMSGAEAADVHLSSVPAERIRRLTAELHSDLSRELDEIDAVVMRLLLNEYATAVVHLRAVARMAASRVDRAGGIVREARRAVHRVTKEMDSSGGNSLHKSEAAE
jgi:hypothetical protein